jgi:Fur family zinc uptake transcriptional regulator
MSLETQIDKARHFCQSRNARFTHLRETVYRILLEDGGAMGAYQLLDSLKLTETQAKPATVYRALDFLLQLGLIHRLESTNAYLACYHFDCSHPVQFLICNECGLVKEMQSERLKQSLDHQAQQHDFVVVTQTIEAHGTCALCR